MGKVKDERFGLEDSEALQGESRAAPWVALRALPANLVQTGLYKPMQGWYARLYTALGLGVIAAAGVWRVYESSIEYTPPGGWASRGAWRWSWAG